MRSIIRISIRSFILGIFLFLMGCASLDSTIPTKATNKEIKVMDEVSVDFNETLGVPTYRASGFIYGLSEDGMLPDRALQKDIKTQFIRAGGAQLGCPQGGFVNGDYERRWASVEAYYARAKAIGATFILLPHDLWGADAVCEVPRWPGDHGDWSEFDRFLGQVIEDAQAAGMTGPDVQWDIWNEPDLLTPVIFWGRSQDQYLEMWRRAFLQIRAAIPEAVIVGPSTAGQPSPVSEWYTRYLDDIKRNQTIPNYLSWHELVPGSDPQVSKDHLDRMLVERGIVVEGYQVNEYGSDISEQQAGPSAWYLGRFERTGIDALRANWGMGGGLYKGMGDLVTEDNQVTPAWWVYQRYADMIGDLVKLVPGAKVDGVAAVDGVHNQAFIILGSRAGIIGEVAVSLKNLPPDFLLNGMINIRIERMPEGSSPLAAPQIVLDRQMTVSGGQLDVSFEWIGAFDAYVIMLSN
jgi:hypothetical protein